MTQTQFSECFHARGFPHDGAAHCYRISDDVSRHVAKGHYQRWARETRHDSPGAREQILGSYARMLRLSQGMPYWLARSLILEHVR